MECSFKKNAHVWPSGLTGGGGVWKIPTNQILAGDRDELNKLLFGIEWKGEVKKYVESEPSRVGGGGTVGQQVELIKKYFFSSKFNFFIYFFWLKCADFVRREGIYMKKIKISKKSAKN